VLPRTQTPVPARALVPRLLRKRQECQALDIHTCCNLFPSILIISSQVLTISRGEGRLRVLVREYFTILALSSHNLRPIIYSPFLPCPLWRAVTLPFSPHCCGLILSLPWGLSPPLLASRCALRPPLRPVSTLSLLKKISSVS
jgi:hypothetical protein